MIPHYKLILCILFGFLTITAAQTIIEVIIYAYLHYGLNHDYREIHFKYYLPIAGIISSIILYFLIITILVRKSMSKDLKFKGSSKFWFIVFDLYSNHFVK